MRSGSVALAGNDLNKLIEAYVNGRGARKELRETADLVRRAMEAHGAALSKWQRALGDFKSALELNSNDADAKRNIEMFEAATKAFKPPIAGTEDAGDTTPATGASTSDEMADLKAQLAGLQSKIDKLGS